MFARAHYQKARQQRSADDELACWDHELSLSGVYALRERLNCGRAEHAERPQSSAEWPAAPSR